MRSSSCKHIVHMFMVVKLIEIASFWCKLCLVQCWEMAQAKVNNWRSMLCHTMHYNYRMAQPTYWVPAILDYMKKVRSNISTVVLAQNPSSDSSLVVKINFPGVHPTNYADTLKAPNFHLSIYGPCQHVLAAFCHTNSCLIKISAHQVSLAFFLVSLICPLFWPTSGGQTTLSLWLTRGRTYWEVTGRDIDMFDLTFFI